MAVLTGEAGQVAAGYVRNGVPTRVGLMWIASPGAVMVSASPDDIGATVSYADQAIALASRSGLPSYSTVAYMTVTATGGSGGYTEVYLNYATFS